MKVVDHDRSEVGQQRRRAANGRLLHCCCICGRLAVWGSGWSYYGSLEEEEGGVVLPKFCSDKCQMRGGSNASAVTDEMKALAREAEWREPTTVYRDATEREKYAAAAAAQQRVKKSQ